MVDSKRRFTLSFIVVGLLILFIFAMWWIHCYCNDNVYETVPVIPRSKVPIVVARYREDVSYLNKEPFLGFPILLYEKGGASATNLSPDVNVTYIPLENVGRETHTYLYHIVNNYDKLADVTIFLPGSCNVLRKRHKTHQLIHQVLSTGNTSFNGWSQWPVIEDMYGQHTVSTYQCSNQDNRQFTPNNMVHPASIRPLKPWFEHFVGNDHINDFFSLYCIFAVSRDHIRGNPKEFYERLLEENSKHSNCEAGFYSELLWPGFFNKKDNPLPASCYHKEDAVKMAHGAVVETLADPALVNIKNLMRMA